MRSFGETGFAGSCAKAFSAVRGEDRGGPGELQELATGGLGGTWTSGLLDATSLGRAGGSRQ